MVAPINERLFPSDGGYIPLQRGTVLLHKKSSYENPMVYVVHDVYDDTEEREKYRVAYQSVNGGELYVRPLDMFTTDRFLVLGQMRDFIASNR